jgi:hypothetical protein
MARNEVKPNDQRPCPEFNQAPTGHITSGRSPDDPSMAFRVPDCGVKAGGQFSSPFFMDDEDLPCSGGHNNQGF